MNTQEPISRDLHKTNVINYSMAYIIDPLTIDNEKINDDEYIKRLIIEKINIFDNSVKSKNYLTRLLYSDMITKRIGTKFNFLINDILVFYEITSEDPFDFKIIDKLTSDKYDWLDEITNELLSKCLVIIK